VNRSRSKFFSNNPAYTLDKSRSHTSDGSNHTNRQDNEVMDQPQVLGAIPRSTRRSTREGKEESNQGTKLPGSGGLSGQEGRTVRTGHADSPARCHGQSARAMRTVRPGATDSP
jgi:hypothetical protein